MVKFALNVMMVGLVCLYLASPGYTVEVSNTSVAPDYSAATNWAYLPKSLHDARAVLFIVAPTVDLGKAGNMNMDINDAAMRHNFVGALNMQLGIYSGTAVFAPFYRQASLVTYNDSEKNRDAFEQAYADIRAAFVQFMKQRENKPFILAGFSQGAQMVKRLVMEFGADEVFAQSFIAAYCIGWRLGEAELARHKHLKPAKGPDDTGVLIFFSSEAEDVTDSLFIPAGTKSVAINPLNWRTDATPASRSQNLGARFTDYAGNTVKFVPQLTGAYIDPVRGSLKCPEIDKNEYPGILFPGGVYHIYDYQFFFENLKKNVAERISAFEKRGARQARH